MNYLARMHTMQNMHALAQFLFKRARSRTYVHMHTPGICILLDGDALDNQMP